MLKSFPDAMLFLQVFIRIYIQFGGFSEQHQGSSRKIPRNFFHVFAGKTSNFMSADANINVNKIFTCVSVANKFVLLKFFSVEILFCMKTVEIGKIYHISGWEKRIQFHNKVLDGIFRELLSNGISK